MSPKYLFPNIYIEHPTIYSLQTIDLITPLQPFSPPLSTSTANLQTLRIPLIRHLTRTPRHTSRRPRPPIPATLPILRRSRHIRLRRRRTRRRRSARRRLARCRSARARRDNDNTAAPIGGVSNNTPGAGDGCGQSARLDVHAAEVEVFVAVGVAVAGELEDAEMPVGAVGGGGAGDGGVGEG